MSSPGSITCWLEQLQTGEQVAIQRLWERYFANLVRLARAKLGAAPRQAVDEEDVALSAFDSFCRGAEQARFPRLADRDDLWQLLVMIACRKAANLARDQSRLKRGGGNVRHASDQAGEDGPLFADLVGREPDPAFAAEVADECRRRLEQLPDDDRCLQVIAVRKMEGYTNAQIAGELACIEGTIERRLRVIRALWTSEEGEA